MATANTLLYPTMKQSFSLKKIAVKLIAPIFYVLLILFLVFYIQNTDFSQLQYLEFSWFYLFIATALALGFRYWGAFIWFVLLKGLGAKQLQSQTAALVYVYAKSWLGRYIPGTAPWILGKIYFASQHGISKNKLAVSSLLEGALQVVVVMALAFILLTFDPRLDVIETQYKVLMLAIVIGCIVAMLPPVFNWLVANAYRLIRRKTLDKEHYADGKTISIGAGLYGIGALVNGFSLFFIAKAVYPELAYADLFFVMGVSSLASAVSMLAFFAPSGLGVREGIQLVLLSLVMPNEIALIITVVMRLWSVAVDFLFFALSWVVKKIR